MQDSKLFKKKFCSLKQNKKDVNFAKKNKIKENLINRLSINPIKLKGIQVSIKKITKLKDEQVIEELTEIKGIGNWTAQIYLMFCLERKDVFPVGDLGIQKGIRDLFSLKELPNAKTMEKYSARWKPNRSIACWYIWKSQRINSIG